MFERPIVKITFVVNTNVSVSSRDLVEVRSLYGELNPIDSGSYFETLLINRWTKEKISYDKFSQSYYYSSINDSYKKLPVSQYLQSLSICTPEIITRIMSKVESIRREHPSAQQVVLTLSMNNELSVNSFIANTDRILHFSRSKNDLQEIRTGSKNGSGVALGMYKRIYKKSDTFRLAKNTIIAGPYEIVKNCADKRIIGLIVIHDAKHPHQHLSFSGPKITIDSKSLKGLKDGTIISLNTSKGEIIRIGKVPSPNKPKKITHNVFYEDFSIQNGKSIQEAKGYSFLNGMELVRSILKNHTSGSYTDALVHYFIHDLKLKPEKPLLYQSLCVSSGSKHIFGKSGGQYIRENPDFFIEELAALHRLLYIYNFIDITLTLPFIRTVKELEDVKKLVIREKLTRSHKFKLFITLQVPSTILQLEEYLDVGIDGLIIDLQCLTDLTLGIDSHVFKKDYKKAEHSYAFMQEIYQKNDGAGVIQLKYLETNGITLDSAIQKMINHCNEVASRRRIPLFVYIPDSFEEEVEQEIKKQTHPFVPHKLVIHSQHV